MKGFRELLSVVGAGLTARKIRTLLIVLGPLIGVGAIVAAVGMTESQKGELKARLNELGTTLIVADSGGSFGAEQDPRFPEDFRARAEALPQVKQVSGVTQLASIDVLPHLGAEEAFRAIPVPVLAVEDNLPAVIEVAMKSGRWIHAGDLRSEARVAILGPGLAEEFAYFQGELRSVLLDDFSYAVVGVLDEFAFDEAFDNTVFIPVTTAEDDFDATPEPARMYVRAVEGETQRAADLLPAAIDLGGNTEEVATDVPSDALEASAQADKALRNIVILMGGLALFVGGVGIANVMSISVIQRSSEIGIRRALGHSRSRIGMQFLLEALAVGILGGFLGVLAGAGVVYVISDLRDWIPVLNWPGPFIWIGPAIGISVLFGLYPSIRAARLEPLETLRLG